MKAITQDNNWSLTLAFHIIFTRTPPFQGMTQILQQCPCNNNLKYNWSCQVYYSESIQTELAGQDIQLQISFAKIYSFMISSQEHKLLIGCLVG